MNPEENKNKKEDRIPIKSLRTFQGDVQEAIEKNKFSETTILVSEQKRKLENPVDPVSVEKFKVRNKNFIVIGVFLIVLGIVSISGLYYIKSNEKVVIEKATKALIAFSEERVISITNLNKQDFFNKISEAQQSWNMPVNSILYLNPLLDGKEVSTEDILAMIGPDMLKSLVRSFGNKYMLGIYSFDKNEPFIILNIGDYSLAYSGMLKWENEMTSNLSSLFNIPTDSASTTNNYIFRDEIVKNRDMRVLKDAFGNSLVLYSFIDRKTLVITKNENILSALVGKILINKQIK